MDLIEACIRGDHRAQKTLYQFYYPYALSVSAGISTCCIKRILTTKPFDDGT